MSNEFKTRNGLIIPTETASTVPYLDANKKLVSSAVTPTTLAYLDANSSIQTQLDAKASASSVTDHLNDTTDAHDASAISSVATGNLSATNVQTALDELQTDIDTRAPSNSPTLVTPSTDIITLDGQASTPANPSAGNYKVYVKDATQKLTVLDSTGAETTVGTGSGGGAAPNYIASPDGTAIGDWVTYDDGASSSPVDGTGGSPGATFAVSTSSTMRSTSNFLFTHDAADRQGEGFSYLMAIDPSDRGKVLRLSFDYLVASGTYADDGMAVWFYDATNAALIQPAPYLIKNSSLIERFNCEVQVPSSCASLRVIFHVTTTTATAYTIRFDDFNFGPQAKLYGSPITDWSTSATGSDTSSNSTVTYQWRRVGDTMEIDYTVSFSGVGDGGTFAVNLPSGYTINSAKLLDQTVGYFRWFDSGTSHKTGTVNYGNTTQLTFLNEGAAAALDGSAFASGDYISANVRVPIVGWSSSLVMSSDADTRAVAATMYRTSSNQTISSTSETKVQLNAASPDTHGGADTTTNYRYTFKTPGLYMLSGLARVNSTNSGEVYAARVKKTGATVISAASTAGSTAHSIPIAGRAISAIAGDYIELFVQSTSDALYDVMGTADDFTYLSIVKISGPSQIAASETVCAYYTGAGPTGTLTSAYNTTTFGTKVKDSHNAYSSGTYTVPVSGVYSIAAQARHDATYAVGNTAGIALFVDGVQNATGLNNAGGVEVSLWPQLSIHAVPLLAGQAVTIRSFNNGTTPTFGTLAVQNYFSIVKVGNY